MRSATSQLQKPKFSVVFTTARAAEMRVSPSAKRAVISPTVTADTTVLPTTTEAEAPPTTTAQKTQNTEKDKSSYIKITGCKKRGFLHPFLFFVISPKRKL